MSGRYRHARRRPSSFRSRTVSGSHRYRTSFHSRHAIRSKFARHSQCPSIFGDSRSYSGSSTYSYSRPAARRYGTTRSHSQSSSSHSAGFTHFFSSGSQTSRGRVDRFCRCPNTSHRSGSNEVSYSRLRSPSPRLSRTVTTPCQKGRSNLSSGGGANSRRSASVSPAPSISRFRRNPIARRSSAADNSGSRGRSSYAAPCQNC